MSCHVGLAFNECKTSEDFTVGGHRQLDVIQVVGLGHAQQDRAIGKPIPSILQSKPC